MRNRVKVQERVQRKEATEECHHFWMIEVANGPMSRGQCKYCGAVKEFYNAFPDFNPMKRTSNPLNFPKLPAVEVDEDSQS
jgi:hypothetical protein